MQISRLYYRTHEYPKDLLNISAPPAILNVLGTLPAGTYAAVVGTRRLTAYGRQITYQLAGDLARAGVVIVSGLALGIDAVAHRAALDAGGKTVAVLANGLNQIYPKSHRGLAIEILKRGGAIVSEQPDDMPPLKQHFVARNRIISGLCKAVIITEAGTDSGALHTANFATEQGRTVMVVPGNVTSTTSVGCNRLLRTGAVAVTDTVDVLQELDINAASATPVKAQSKEEQTILDLLAAGKNTSQELIEQSQLSAGQFANIISLMEITGKVRSLGAGQWMVR